MTLFPNILTLARRAYVRIASTTFSCNILRTPIHQAVIDCYYIFAFSELILLLNTI